MRLQQYCPKLEFVLFKSPSRGGLALRLDTPRVVPSSQIAKVLMGHSLRAVSRTLRPFDPSSATQRLTAPAE